MTMYGRRIRYVIRRGSDKDNVLFFFHGIGETGGNSKRVLKHGPLSTPLWNSINWTIIYPMSPLLQWWDTFAMKQFMDSFAYKRVHISGVSMGAYLVWSLLSLYPTSFVTAIPVSGGANPLSRFSRLLQWKPFSFPSLSDCTASVWAFHGSNDAIVPVRETIRLSKLVTNSRVTLYERTGHEKTMSRAFSEPSLVVWVRGVVN